MSIPQPECKVGATCYEEGSFCNRGTESCCGKTYDSFHCDCERVGESGELVYACYYTDACLRPSCETSSPTVAGSTESSPNPTPSVPFDTIMPTDLTASFRPTDGAASFTPTPVPSTVNSGGGSGFICPSASFVGCTAADPDNPEDECPRLGDPCNNGNPGEFCCRDACPRNYCTAKQGNPVNVVKLMQFMVPLPEDVPEVDVAGEEEEKEEEKDESEKSVDDDFMVPLPPL